MKTARLNLWPLVVAFAVALAGQAAFAETFTVANVAALATARPGDGDIVVTLGKTTVGDGGTRTYRYDTDSVAAADGFNVVDGPGSVGRYVALDQEMVGVQVVNVKQYGAVGDGLTDDWSAIQGAIDACGGSTYTPGVSTVLLPPGRYIISRPLYITKPIRFVGSGWNATSIEASGIDDGFAILVSGNYSFIEDMSIVNTDGSGIAWIIGGYKSAAKNVWVGGTVRDIAFLNAGSQQLSWNNLWVSSNGYRVAPGSTFPKVGFSVTSFAKYGTAIADIEATGLSGLTLTFQFAGVAQTVTVGGNHIRDVVEAINAKTIDSGIVATYSSDDELFLSATGYDDGTDAANCDNDLILTNGTGLWSAVGFTAGTYTSGNTIGATNGSQINHCHAEGCTKYGLIVDSSRHTDSKRGTISIVGGVFQGNDTTDVVIKDSRYVNFHGVYVEPSGGVVLALDQADFLSFTGGIVANMTVEDTHNAVFSGVNITQASIDSSSSANTFVGCNLSTSLTDYGLATRLISCSSNAYPDGSVAIGTGIGSYRVVNKNTMLDYSSASSVNTPWGFDISGPTTSARVAGVDGPYAFEINNQTWADWGLQYTIPSAEAGTTSSEVKQYLSVFARVKRTDAAEATATAPGCVIDFGNAHIERACATADTVDEEYPLNTWVEKRWSFEIDPTHADIVVTLTPDQAGGAGLRQLVVDAFVIAIGDCPVTAVHGHGEFNRMLLAGREITSASSAPASGSHRTGAIVFNSAPTAGGKIGWVCTAGGSPGTWKEFGAIDP